MYKPTTPFVVPMRVLIPTTTRVQGVAKKVYTEGAVFFGSFRTFGGSEREVNDVIQVDKTATIDTWFRPDITADCQIMLLESGQVYDIINEPEDIEMRHQYLQFKVRKVGGAA